MIKGLRKKHYFSLKNVLQKLFIAIFEVKLRQLSILTLRLMLMRIYPPPLYHFNHLMIPSNNKQFYHYILCIKYPGLLSIEGLLRKPQTISIYLKQNQIIIIGLVYHFEILNLTEQLKVNFFQTESFFKELNH